MSRPCLCTMQKEEMTKLLEGEFERSAQQATRKEGLARPFYSPV